jgi:hypothetical protein
MTSTDSIHQELSDIRKDLEFIKHILSEDYELSENAKRELAKARALPESEYVDL